MRPFECADSEMKNQQSKAIYKKVYVELRSEWTVANVLKYEVIHMFRTNKREYIDLICDIIKRYCSSTI